MTQVIVIHVFLPFHLSGLQTHLKSTMDEYRNHFSNTGNQFNNTGSGPQNANTDQGVQYNNTGPGTQNNSSSQGKAPLPKNFVRAVIEFAGRDRGDQNGAWTDPTSEDIMNIWTNHSPSDMKDKFLDYKKDITQTLTEWRNSFGKAAIEALDLELQGKQNEEKQKHIDDGWTGGGNLSAHKCYYERLGFLRSPIVAKTFLKHLDAIGSKPGDQFWKENKPISALVLTILAIERAFRLCSSSTNSISQSGGLSDDNRARELTSAALMISKNDKIKWKEIVSVAENERSKESSAALPSTFPQ
ncbi:hypothetical protein D9758_018664 [Tetrapyrgos nigripes]|uniref:Uncharacterized protein n=1 Tax=Tetrapyrgos nigripes TaxID=182062 RepID=A0A8H5F0F3_9AGAR|nr:hypothetical protein D9758_018664 [Tetrapyrgos nigripes]